ncbi:MAG: T9SS type A sorting domain-containing protein [Bacteroidota bacterium]
MIKSRIKNRILAATIILLALTLQVNAENRLSVVRQSPDQISIELQNSEPVSAIQFSVNARGSITLANLTMGSRAASNGWELYPYQKDDSTWNVVMLSAPRKPFESGNGTLVRINFSKDFSKPADSNIVFLSRTEIVNPQARILSLFVGRLAWSATELSRPAVFSLGQNFPNPFNPSTTISYKLGHAANVRLVIYDVAGREIKRLVSQYQFPGQYAVTWTSADESGRNVPSGMYIARLQVESESSIRKMVLTR